METHAALLILIASVAVGVGAAAIFSRRFRALWRRSEREESAYRGRTIEHAPQMPTRVRVAIAAANAMAGMCAFRVAASIADVIELTDEPHVRLDLAPRGPLATVLEITLAFVAAAAALRLIAAARALAARRESPHARSAIVLLFVSAALAAATIFAITRVPIVIYWQRRMLLYLVVHAVLATTTALVLTSSRARSG